MLRSQILAQILLIPDNLFAKNRPDMEVRTKGAFSGTGSQPARVLLLTKLKTFQSLELEMLPR